MTSESPLTAHSAARAGLVDRRTAGRLRVRGRDAVSFLHALLSNDVASLEAGRGCYATYLTPQGRMIADTRVYRRPDEVLLVVARGLAPALAERLDQLLFSEDVRIADASAELAQASVIGARAGETIARVFGLSTTEVAALPVHGQVVVPGGFVARTDDALAPSFDAFVPAGEYDRTVERLREAGAVMLGEDDADALRIEAGRPRFGVDMTEETIPLEAGLLDRAISTSKGCYVGQEVIIRVLHRGGGRVARRLVKLAFDEGVMTPPAAGAPLTVDGHETGRVTSAAISAASGRVDRTGLRASRRR